MFILPTLLESFGLTYLEAMQNNCPIITSDLEFARYVCGDAALYFDPKSPSSILDMIIKLKDDQKLRMRLVENGQKRIKSFFKSWDDVAREYLKVIESI